jgi:superfamily II DNA or RNA helicase
MTVELRPYQHEAVSKVMAAFDGGDPSTLMVLPTGTGKTHTAAAICSHVVRDGGRVLWLAHRGELLEQAGAAMGRAGLKWSVEKAEQSAFHGSLYGDDEVVLASKDTLQRKRLEKWPRRHFRLIVTDEAHHATASTYQNIYSYFEDYCHLGLTATPDRGDGSKLGSVFPHLAFEYKLARAIKEGFLVRPIFLCPPTEIDLSKIRTTGGDLNLGDLEKEISEHIEELVNSVREHIGRRPAMVFTPDVGSAMAFSDGLRQVGVTSRYAHGKSDDRDLIPDQFRDGAFQSLCNCALYTEGFDAPPTSLIALARKTKSRPLFTQMVGRGLRLAPNKEDCLILDWGMNSGKHDVVSPIELFDAADADERTLQIAGRLVAEGKEKDPLIALERAEVMRNEEVVRVAVRERAARYKMLAYDPFQVATLLGVPQRSATEYSEPATPGQVSALGRFKLDGKGMTKRQASALLDQLIKAAREGRASHRQVASLVSHGVPTADARSLSFEEASARLDVLMGARR